jgi:hypothetical protein
MAPPELQSIIDGIGSGSGDTSSEAITESLRQLNTTQLTAEEKLRGIVPDYINLALSDYLVSEVGSENAPRQWLNNLVNYKFLLRRFQFRQGAMGHSFHPDVMVGFPGAVLDPISSFGIVDTAVHTFHTRGGSTQITLGYIMNPEAEVPGAPAIPTLPVWFNQQYGTGSAYQTLFGSDPVGGSAQDSAAQLQDLFSQLEKVKDSHAFAMDINRRPIATEEDLFNFLGASATDTNQPVLSGGPFRADHQAAVRDHVNFIGQHSALLGY